MRPREHGVLKLFYKDWRDRLERIYFLVSGCELVQNRERRQHSTLLYREGAVPSCNFGRLT